MLKKFVERICKKGLTLTPICYRLFYMSRTENHNHKSSSHNRNMKALAKLDRKRNRAAMKAEAKTYNGGK